MVDGEHGASEHEGADPGEDADVDQDSADEAGEHGAAPADGLSFSEEQPARGRYGPVYVSQTFRALVCALVSQQFFYGYLRVILARPLSHASGIDTINVVEWLLLSQASARWRRGEGQELPVHTG